MTTKRKAANNVDTADKSKRSRLNEWLSDSEQDSDFSESQQKENSGSASEEDDTEEEDGTIEMEETAQNSNTQRVFTAERLQKVIPSQSRLLQKQSTLETQVSPGVADSSSNFAELGVAASLVASLSAMSIRKPTPVQFACIPPLLAGKLARHREHHSS